MARPLDAVVRFLNSKTLDTASAHEVGDIVEVADDGVAVAFWVERLEGGPDTLAVPSDVVESWRHDPYCDALDARAVVLDEEEDDNEPDDPELLVASAQALAAACAQRRVALGATSMQIYRVEYEGALEWARRKYDPSRGPFEVFAGALERMVWRRISARFSRKALRAERADDAARQRAESSELALGEYLEKVAVDCAKWLAWKRCKPFAEMRESNLVGAIVEKTLAVFRHGGWSDYVRPGRAAFWKVRDDVITAERKRKRLWAVEVPAERIHAAVLRPDHALSLRQIEQRWPRPREDEWTTMAIVEELRPCLSKTQNRYLDALLIELQLDDSRGIVTRIAQRMRRNKAQVSRAVERIRGVAIGLGVPDVFDLE